jgi:protein-disulfide isomerase
MSSNPSKAGASRGGPSRNARERLQREQEAQRKRERRILGLVALAVVLLIVGVGIGVQQWRSGRTPSALPSTAGSLAPVTIADGKPIVLGQAGAPVKVQLYEDFHCPHCADFEEELGPTLTAEQQSGRVAVELYPMSFIDEGSATAANAMACAAEAGFGQAYYLGLFANHTLEWSDSQLVDLAGKVSSQVPASFGSCVTTKAHSGWVDSINAAAQANGVTSTPTMFINGAPVDVGTLTPESLKGMIDEAASK